MTRLSRSIWQEQIQEMTRLSRSIWQDQIQEMTRLSRSFVSCACSVLVLFVGVVPRRILSGVGQAIYSLVHFALNIYFKRLRNIKLFEINLYFSDDVILIAKSNLIALNIGLENTEKVFRSTQEYIKIVCIALIIFNRSNFTFKHNFVF